MSARLEWLKTVAIFSAIRISLGLMTLSRLSRSTVRFMDPQTIVSVMAGGGTIEEHPELIGDVGTD